MNALFSSALVALLLAPQDPAPEAKAAVEAAKTFLRLQDAVFDRLFEVSKPLPLEAERIDLFTDAARKAIARPTKKRANPKAPSASKPELDTWLEVNGKYSVVLRSPPRGVRHRVTLEQRGTWRVTALATTCSRKGPHDTCADCRGTGWSPVDPAGVLLLARGNKLEVPAAFPPAEKLDTPASTARAFLVAHLERAAIPRRRFAAALVKLAPLLAPKTERRLLARVKTGRARAAARVKALLAEVREERGGGRVRVRLKLPGKPSLKPRLLDCTLKLKQVEGRWRIEAVERTCPRCELPPCATCKGSGEDGAQNPCDDCLDRPTCKPCGSSGTVRLPGKG